MLLGLPTHDLDGVGLLHAINLNPLDDDIAPADCDDDTLLLQPREQTPDRLRQHRRVHHLPLHDCIRQHRGRGHMRQLGLSL